MNKIGIVVKREFLYRIKKRSFVILTVLMPFLLAAVMIVPVVLSSLKGDERKEVVIIDRTGIYAPCFKSDGMFNFVLSDRMRKEYRAEDSEVYAVVSIWGDLAKDPSASRVYSRKEISSELQKTLNDVLANKIKDQKLAAVNVPGLDKVVDECGKGYDIKTVKWDGNGEEKESSTETAVFIGMFFTMLIYMFVLSYGGMVMQSVTEEKSNRIMELMVSSVKPFTLMMGKIIGVALVGLFQMLIWAVMLGLILAAAGAVAGLPGASLLNAGHVQPVTAGAMADGGSVVQMLSTISSINFAEIISMFVVYFIGGYLLYASFFAGIGSAVNSSEDTGQFMAPTIVIMAFALYAGIFGISNPDGPLAFWCSMIPLTSPIVMMVRVPFGVPLWQELLSVALLYASAFFMIWLSGRIYRVGILMYGKKPSVGELLKWVKYK